MRATQNFGLLRQRRLRWLLHACGAAGAAALAFLAMGAAGQGMALDEVEAAAGPVLLFAMAGWTRYRGLFRPDAARAAPPASASPQALGLFSASIAHEISQPLAAIVTASDAGLRWLARDTPDVEQARAAIARVREDAQRAQEIVRSLRALTQLEPPNLAPVAMDRVLHETLAAMGPALHGAGVRVHAVPGSGFVACADQAQLQQVLRNLVDNAVDAMRAMPASSRELRLDHEVHQGMLQVNVHDTGQGLPAGPHARIFEPFVTTKTHGMGIGLHLCQRIVHAHGGRLWCAARPGGGTRFSFSLPLLDGTR